jgi:uncharacterized protein (DUF433 family)
MVVELQPPAPQGNTAMDERRQALIRKWIEPNPVRPGGENARLREYGVPVWALIGHARATGRDAAAVAGDYDVPQEAVEAALAYYEQHRSQIDTRIAANAA